MTTLAAMVVVGLLFMAAAFLRPPGHNDGGCGGCGLACDRGEASCSRRTHSMPGTPSREVDDD